MKTMKTIKSLSTIALLIAGSFLATSANALVIQTQTFNEFGSTATDQNGFHWDFTALSPITTGTDISLTMDWERMDFSGGEGMEIFAEGTYLGDIGFGSSTSSVTATNAEGGLFNSDADGSFSFNIDSLLSASLLSDGMLSLTAIQSGVDSSGGAPGSPYGFVNATISYAPVPEPSTIAMFGAAFLMLGFVGYRNRKS
jgi:hypothetical protein